jgi:hypothetical protein
MSENFIDAARKLVDGLKMGSEYVVKHDEIVIVGHQINGKISTMVLCSKYKQKGEKKVSVMPGLKGMLKLQASRGAGAEWSVDYQGVKYKFFVINKVLTNERKIMEELKMAGELSESSDSSASDLDKTSPKVDLPAMKTHLTDQAAHQKGQITSKSGENIRKVVGKQKIVANPFENFVPMKKDYAVILQEHWKYHEESERDVSQMTFGQLMLSKDPNEAKYKGTSDFIKHCHFLVTDPTLLKLGAKLQIGVKKEIIKHCRFITREGMEICLEAKLSRPPTSKKDNTKEIRITQNLKNKWRELAEEGEGAQWKEIEGIEYKFTVTKAQPPQTRCSTPNVSSSTNSGTESAEDVSPEEKGKSLKKTTLPYTPNQRAQQLFTAEPSSQKRQPPSTSSSSGEEQEKEKPPLLKRRGTFVSIDSTSKKFEDKEKLPPTNPITSKTSSRIKKGKSTLDKQKD